VPLPSCLEPLSPQHCTLPSDRSAQTDRSPTETAVAPASPTTATGVDEHPGEGEFVEIGGIPGGGIDGGQASGPAVVPMPSAPLVLLPQHCTVPPESDAHAAPAPTEIEVGVSTAVLSGVAEHALDRTTNPPRRTASAPRPCLTSDCSTSPPTPYGVYSSTRAVSA
jgi:hypothetical protein